MSCHWRLNECLSQFLFFFFFTLQLEDKRAEIERQFISMKVHYQSLQKQHALSKQQLQRMKVLCLKGNIMLLFKWRWIEFSCVFVIACGWLGAGPDSHSDAAPGIQGWFCTGGKTPVYAVWEKWRNSKSNGQTAETRENGGKGSF